MRESEMPGIPTHVIEDLNEETLKRYLSDRQFREDLLSDPGGTNDREGLGLSGRTVDWIHERVTHHTLATLMAEPIPDVPTA